MFYVSFGNVEMGICTSLVTPLLHFGHYDWEYFGDLLGILWGLFGDILEMFWGYLARPLFSEFRAGVAQGSSKGRLLGAPPWRKGRPTHAHLVRALFWICRTFFGFGHGDAQRFWPWRCCF